MENVKDPEDHIPEVLRRVRTGYMTKTYRVADWTDHEHFLEQLAFKTGKLLKVCRFLYSIAGVFLVYLDYCIQLLEYSLFI